MKRSERRWARWDEAVDAGARPDELASAVSDASLVELLASAQPGQREAEVELLAEELLARLARFRSVVGDAAAVARHELATAIDAAEDASRLTHESAKKVRHHMEVREDQIEDEPQVAESAARAAQDAYDALEGARDAEERLVRLEDDVERRAGPDEG